MTRNQTLFVIIADLIALAVLAVDFFWGTGGFYGALFLLVIAATCVVLMSRWRRRRGARIPEKRKLR